MARSVNVILQADVGNLGQVGEIVAVKPGFARNFLIPQQKALLASKRSVRELEHQKRLTEHRKGLLKKESEALAAQVKGLTLTITAKAGEHDKLFGSIGTRDIAKAMADAGHEVPHRNIKLAEPIKALGTYTVDVRLQADVMAQVKVLVVPQSAEEAVEEIDDAEEAVVGMAPEFRPYDLM